MLEIFWSNTSLAFLFTNERQIKIVKIKPILGKFFLCNWGWFNIDSSKAYSIFKQRVYLYNVNNINPLDVETLQQCEIYRKEKNIVEIKQWIDANGKEQRDPISPAIEKSLLEYMAIDGNTLSVGTAHIVATYKLLEKRSKTILHIMPLVIVFAILGAIALILIFGPQFITHMQTALANIIK